ncbi:MAG: Cyclic di-GMP phosphodiesterase response regulator RpfG [Deltaproteobacteria bacterium ADurb.Bin510]|nr:MAG: Cyclic di-GMP phosphodiesterase response regulator RpfG [Deltaproteobacteria bacterium ADurb.Bin510]
MQVEKVLIVDDDPGIRETLTELIEQLGYATSTAEDGLAALEKLKDGPLLCVLTDIMMPNMTGLELIKRIKQFNLSLPVIVITGYASVEIAIDAMKYGASDFISKPFKIKQIELILNKIRREKDLLEENRRINDELQLHRMIDNLASQLEDKTQEITTLHAMSERITSMKGIRELVTTIEEVSLELIDDASVRFFPLNRQSWKLLDPEGGERELPPCLLDGQIHREEITGLFDYNDFRTMLPLMIEAQLFGALDITTPVALNEETEGKLSYLLQRTAERMENVALYEGLYENVLATLNSMAKIIDARDPYTSQHSTRVTTLAVELGRTLELSGEDLDVLCIAASLHDIGKVGVPDTVLLKPGRLDPEEYETIKQHPEIGANIIQPIIPMRREADIIRHHHESFDGKGYPDGLKGYEIPLLSRVIALADAFDAMTSDRPYRKGLPYDTALAEIERCKGSQFDPELAEVFMTMIRTNYCGAG